MSLVPTYVQMDDGRWYNDPVLGENDWFVCWDDDDPIELVVYARDPKQAVFMLEVVQERFEAEGCRLSIADETRGLVESGERNFSNEEDDYEFLPAYQAWVKLQPAPPVALLLFHDGVTDERPVGDCVYYPIEGARR